MRIFKNVVAVFTALASLVSFNTIKKDFDTSSNAQSYEQVNIQELSDFLLNKNTTFSESFDVNGDGKVNVFDLILLKRNVIESNLKYDGFIKANGRILEDEFGQEFIVKGMAFGNNVWSNPSVPPRNQHHTEESYKELAEMGFNSVRFYINYGLFESDLNPYEYNETGFEWLDENIEQASKYGIKLIINMHYPQGGYQSQGNGMELWTDEENQKRLTALWTAIAERYSNETGVLGYGIVNEPVLPLVTTEGDCLNLWQKVAQDITDGIRSVDENHPIFVERMCAVKNLETGKTNWSNFNDENNYMKINDDNIVYEFHYYDPHMYTHQDFKWAGTSGYNYKYPDETLAMAVDSVWETATFNGDIADVNESDWQYLESSVMEIDDASHNIIGLVFQAENVGENGIVYADNLKLDEYDENGNFIRTIHIENFESLDKFHFWSNDGNGSSGKSDTVGYDDTTSSFISSTTDDANLSRNSFSATLGHKYVASGYFKLENVSKDALIRPRVDVLSSRTAYVFNKEYLESGILSNIEYSYENNVPIYCGEFGVGANCFKDDRGGTEWVKDVIDIFIDNNISFNYHTYHEESFGLYQNSPLSQPDQRNDELYKTFLEVLN